MLKLYVYVRFCYLYNMCHIWLKLHVYLMTNIKSQRTSICKLETNKYICQDILQPCFWQQNLVLVIFVPKPYQIISTALSQYKLKLEAKETYSCNMKNHVSLVCRNIYWQHLFCCLVCWQMSWNDLYQHPSQTAVQLMSDKPVTVRQLRHTWVQKWHFNTSKYWIITLLLQLIIKLVKSDKKIKSSMREVC